MKKEVKDLINAFAKKPRLEVNPIYDVWGNFKYHKQKYNKVHLDIELYDDEVIKNVLSKLAESKSIKIKAIDIDNICSKEDDSILNIKLEV